MCGITGFILLGNKNSVNFNENMLTKMNNTMFLRGPDDAGIYISNEDDNVIGIANRRLKIIDLSERGHQPMTNEDETIWVVFNGEIFNYNEIREDLILKGHIFKSDSDTEVIVHGYEEYGIEKLLEKFNGQFAICIYDKTIQKVILIRDRLGIKPLYISELEIEKEKVILFGSTINSILANEFVPRKVNYGAISDYISFRYSLGESTFFKHIKRIPPGFMFEFNLSNKQLTKKQYYNLKDNIDIIRNKKSSEMNINETLELLRESIKLRLISDVPFGAYLSGGVDSSAVVALMSEQIKSPILTYTIGFPEENEFHFADMVAEKYKTKHTTIEQDSKDYFSVLKWLIEQRGEPLGVPNEVPLFIMSKALKKDFTVVLSGEGADEIFMGYGKIFRSPEDWKRINNPIPTFIKKFLFRSVWKKYGNQINKMNSYTDLFIHRYSYHPHELKKQLFNDSVTNEIEKEYGMAEFEYYQQFFGQYFDDVKHWPIENQISYVFEKVHLPNLLQRVDNSTLSTSVEGRVPFVDHTLVEKIIALTPKYKLKWKNWLNRTLAFFKNSDQISENHDIPKYLLKKSFEDILPDEVLYRKKKGFPVPLGNWFSKDFISLIESYLLSSESQTREIFKENFIRDMIQNYDGSWKSGFLLWQLLNIEIWFRHYLST